MSTRSNQPGRPAGNQAPSKLGDQDHGGWRNLYHRRRQGHAVSLRYAAALARPDGRPLTPAPTRQNEKAGANFTPLDKRPRFIER
jgi:hypothetical protein